MSSPIITKDLLEIWNKNRNINPITGKKIKVNSKFYKQLLKEDYTYKQIFKIDDTVDDKDPVTLNTFWIMKEGKKQIVYEGNIEDLIFYKDSHNFVRCFEKETLSYLKAHKITKNPITQEEIPKEILDSIEERNLDEDRNNLTIKEKALEIFQKFSKISIFIDSEWFLELAKDKLKKFYYEVSSFYKENFSHEQRKIISPENTLFRKDSDLNNMELEEIQLYILNEINILLDVQNEELKYMINYILIGALGFVIPEIRELYPDFSFSF